MESASDFRRAFGPISSSRICFTMESRRTTTIYDDQNMEFLAAVTRSAVMDVAQDQAVHDTSSIRDFIEEFQE